MLFDLRSRGRRTTVKVVYSMLAVLMGAGLILFGIGGATSGGFLNGLTGGGGGGGSSNSPQKTEQHLEQIVRQNPSNAAAWARLVTVRYGLATAGGQGVQPTKAQLEGVAQAWQQYVKHTNKPTDDIALTMVSVYGPGALNQPKQMVGAIEAHLAATRKPTASDYELYSVVATQASQTRKAALAKQQAEQLAAAGKKGKARKQAIAKVNSDIASNLAALQQASGAAGAQTVAG
jgi:hypothetical protein